MVLFTTESTAMLLEGPCPFLLRKWHYEFNHSLTPMKLKMGLLLSVPTLPGLMTLFLDFMDSKRGDTEQI